MDFDKLAFRPFVFLLRFFFSFFLSLSTAITYNVSHFLDFKKSENTIAELGYSNRIDCEQSIQKKETRSRPLLAGKTGQF